MTSPLDKDFYTVLGVNHQATPEQIHEAYKGRARIAHPDRFDPKRQPQDWKLANDMLVEINEAYAILRDDLSRFQYDQHLANQRFHQQSQAASSERSSSPSHSSASDFFDLAGGQVMYKDLAKHIQDRLCRRQDNIGEEQFQIELESVVLNYLFIPILFVWFGYLLSNVDAARWTPNALLWRGGVTAAIAFFTGHNAFVLFRWIRCTLKPYFYVTPLYFIKTDYDRVWFWPILELKDVDVTHHYRDSTHQTCHIALKFSDHDELLSLSSKQKADMMDRMKTFGFRLRGAYAHGDHLYLKRHNDFLHFSTADSEVVENVASIKREKTTITIASVFVCVIGFLAAIFMNMARSEWIRHPVPKLVTSQPERVTHSSVLPQPFPYIGSLSVFTSEERIASFQIKTTSGSHYFVKFSDAYTDAPILTLFVQGGSTAHVSVPMGTYQVRYAIGTTWYGREYLFGPDTLYYQIDQLLTTQILGNQVRGFTISLNHSPIEKSGSHVINGMAF